MRGATYCTLVGVLACAWCGPARAGSLTITAAGAAQGLSLSTFADGFPNDPAAGGGVGPLGVAFVNGTVLVSDHPGNVRIFPNDTDGQHAGSAPVAQNYGGTNAFDLAQLNGKIYMTQEAIGDVVQINNNGTFNQVIVGGFGSPTGMIADRFTGLLYVSTVGLAYAVDPVAKTASVFVNANLDGLSLSPDGSVLYGARVGDRHIIGYSTANGAQVYDSGAISGLDGTAVGTGPFTGYIFANTNFGQVFEVTLGSSPVQTLIATGGSRGDFVTVDPTTNTLMLTQTDTLVRLSGASFTSVPEPASLVMAGTAAVAGLGFWVLRRTRATV
ncbi:MAG TPA: hypothetical protein VKA15_17565 [Isosphaeraceae bacterium]|nr:hypothetical protein [Isosphaeraceae bacterium]